jgi:hypothetical protein
LLLACSTRCAGFLDMSTNPVPLAHKQPRVLACVLCQHRKIKCDRSTPCSNCLKAGVTCTPSTPAPARKRRRPNQDLQERLARCEELLKQYATGSAPATPVAQTSSSNGFSAGTPASTLGSGSSSAKWFPAGTVVTEDGGVRFMDSYLWASVYDEVSSFAILLLFAANMWPPRGNHLTLPT